MLKEKGLKYFWLGASQQMEMKKYSISWDGKKTDSSM